MLSKPLVLYNSLSGKKEEFKPLKKNHLGIYVCGPTVYSNVHLGNCRTFISFDIIYRYFMHKGYKVRYVRNITDVGHLEDDGQDRINKKAKLEKLEPMEVSNKYTNDFKDQLRELNCLHPNIEPLASGHIVEQIESIEKMSQVEMLQDDLDLEAKFTETHFDDKVANVTDSLKNLISRKKSSASPWSWTNTATFKAS